MKKVKFLLGIWILFIALNACSTAEKSAHERRNLMMPEKSDLKRNDKYKPSKEKKTYSNNKKKNKKKKNSY
jgi:hypothetical protein